MSDVDRYDVESAQRDAERNARSYTDDEVRALRWELEREVYALREEIRALERVLQSRTDHLV